MIWLWSFHLRIANLVTVFSLKKVSSIELCEVPNTHHYMLIHFDFFPSFTALLGTKGVTAYGVSFDWCGLARHNSKQSKIPTSQR